MAILAAALPCLLAGGCTLGDGYELPGLQESPCQLETRTYRIDAIELPESPLQAMNLAFNLDLDDSGRPDNAGGQAISSLTSNFGSAESWLPVSIQEALDDGRVDWLITVETCAPGSEGYDAAYVRMGLARGQRQGDGYAILDDDTVPAVGQRQAASWVAEQGIGIAPLSTLADVLGDHPTRWNRGFGMAIELDEGAEEASGRLGLALEEGYLEIVAEPMAAYFSDRLAAGTSELAADMDSDEDGVVTPEEFSANSTIRSLLAPDLDMVIEEAGGVEYCPLCDGEKDSLSFGLGFHAVPVEVQSR